MSEIGDHLRQDTCTPARLACTAAAVSVVAAIAVAGASAVLPAPEGGSVPTGTAGGYRGEAGCTIATGPYVFSFAVERPSLQPSGCARKHA